MNHKTYLFIIFIIKIQKYFTIGINIQFNVRRIFESIIKYKKLAQKHSLYNYICNIFFYENRSLNQAIKNGTNISNKAI